MKRIALFIGLKVAEISAVVFVPWWIGKLLNGIPFIGETEGVFMIWMLGVLGILILGVMGILITILVHGIIIIAIPEFIKANWKLVDKILEDK